MDAWAKVERKEDRLFS